MLHNPGRLGGDGEPSRILSLRKAVGIDAGRGGITRRGTVIVHAEGSLHAGGSAPQMNPNGSRRARRRRRWDSPAIAIDPAAADDRGGFVTVAGPGKASLRRDGSHRRRPCRRTGSVRGAAHRAVASDHGHFHGIEPPEGGPVQEIPIPLGRRAGGRHSRRRLRPRQFKPPARLARHRIGPIVGVTGQRIEQSGIAGGIGENRDGRYASASKGATIRRFAGAIGHAARVVHEDQNIRGDLVADERRDGIVLVHRLGLQGTRSRKTAYESEHGSSTNGASPALHGTFSLPVVSLHAPPPS